MPNVRVALWGLGAMGGGMARLLQEKEGFEIVAAVDRNPSRANKDLGEALKLDRELGLTVYPEPGDVFSQVKPDITLIATSSFTKEVYPQIELVAKSGSNVICIAEEMAYPAAQEPELAQKIDAIAKENGITVLGTGINPGFVLDTLIIALTGVCTHVESIKAVRVNDLSPFGPTVMRTQGVGTTPEEFQRGLESGEIVGHIGFPESIHMIAAALGWKIDEIEQTREPIISKTHRETEHVRVEPGMVAGCKHIAYAKMNGKTVITLEHPQQIHPHLEGVDTGDYIYIKGTPEINMAIKPEIPGGIGTIAMAVNMIPHVIKAEPGLKHMHELPVPAAIADDIRKLV